MDGLGFDKAAFEIGVDRACGPGGGLASVNRPRAHFFFVEREEGPEPKQLVSAVNERRDTAFLDPKLLEILLGLIWRKVAQIALQLRTNDDRMTGVMDARILPHSGYLRIGFDAGKLAFFDVCGKKNRFIRE